MFDTKSGTHTTYLQTPRTVGPNATAYSDSVKPAVAWIILHHGQCSIMFNYQFARDNKLGTDYTHPVRE
jgi:hypothetical protein